MREGVRSLAHCPQTPLFWISSCKMAQQHGCNVLLGALALQHPKEESLREGRLIHGQATCAIYLSVSGTGAQIHHHVTDREWPECPHTYKHMDIQRTQRTDGLEKTA